MPRSGQVHVDKPLSNYAVQYSQDKAMYIADQVLKRLSVMKESDKYFTYLLKDVVTPVGSLLRADGAESKEATWDITTASYNAEEYALKDIVTDRARKNADQPIQVEQDTTGFLTNLLMLDHEIAVADEVFSTANFSGFTSALGAADQWDNYTSPDSDPFEDAETGKNSTIKNALVQANTGILGYEVFAKVKNHPLVLDRIKYTGSNNTPAMATENTLAEAWGLERVLVGKGVKNTANSGQSVSNSYIWGKFAMFCYIAPSPPRKGITLGTTFEAQKFQVSRWRKDERKGDMLEASHIVDRKITVPGAGYLFSTVIS